jgi:hypothetical protein
MGPKKDSDRSKAKRKFVLYTILCMKYCYKCLNKQLSGVRERIIHFTLILMGKWFRFSNKSVFEQPLGTNYVRQPRFHCIFYFYIFRVTTLSVVHTIYRRVVE